MFFYVSNLNEQIIEMTSSMMCFLSKHGNAILCPRKYTVNADLFPQNMTRWLETRMYNFYVSLCFLAGTQKWNFHVHLRLTGLLKSV